MNVNDSKPKSLFKWEGPPDFKTMTALQARLWLDKQKSRWVKGYGGLNGFHYFYATIGTLKTSRNKYIPPRVRDGDILVFESYAEAKRTEQDIFIAKRRGFALSSIFGAGIPFYYALSESGSVNLMTSADQNRLNGLYRDKIMPFYNGLNPAVKPGIVSGQQRNLLHLGTKVGKTVEGLDSLIMGVPTAGGPDEAGALESYRATSIFIDEVFLHSYASTVLSSAQQSVSDDLVKISPIVLGGSCGVASSKSTHDMQMLWQDAQHNDLMTIFIPGTMCVENAAELDENGNKTGRILNFCQNGISDQEAAREWILKTRDKLQKAKDKSKYYQFLKAYPLTIDEVFEFNTVGAFSEDVMNALVDISVRISKNPKTLVPVYIYEKDNGQVVAKPYHSDGFTPDKSGWQILEFPEPDVLYGIGNDPIPFSDNVQDGRHSDLVSVVARMDNAEPVAFYRERTHDPDIATKKNILLSRLYNDAKIMIEMNQGGVLSHKIRDAGMRHILAPQPICFGSFSYKKRDGHGWWKGSNATEAYAELVKVIKNNGEHINMKELVDELKKFLTTNTDLADAYVSFLVYRLDYLFRKNKSSLREKIPVEMPQTVWKNGKLVTEWVTAYVDKDGDLLSKKDPSIISYGR